MSYEPTVWKAGDTVTSAKLNKLEQGVASNVLVVNTIIDEENETVTLNKTWQEIFNADFAIVMLTNQNFVAEERKEYIPIASVSHLLEGSYSVVVGGTRYITDSADGYPIGDMGK